jgi:cytochrome P450
MLVGANYDPKVFADPRAFLIDRENARRNLAFGFGAHHCLGAALARLEAEAVWKQLLIRFPNVKSWKLEGKSLLKNGRVIRGLETLPISLGATDKQLSTKN